TLTRFFLRSFQAYITMSETVNAELHAYTQKPSLNIAHPINESLGQAVERSLAREKLGLREEDNILLFFGIVRKYKGLHLLIESLAQDCLDKINLKLLVVGEFYEDEDEYRQLIHELGLTDRVIITNQYIPTEDVKIYFSAANLVTQTYITASQSGVTQMAYNFNRPILVTNVGGLAEVVIDGKTGYLCQKKPKDIARAIADFFVNKREPEFEQEVSRVKEQYSWKHFAQQVMKMAKEL
ncbi:MAG: glycosyltransferase, partial [Luteibaculum sp.]